MYQESSKASQQREVECPPPYQISSPMPSYPIECKKSELKKQRWLYRCRAWLTDLFPKGDPKVRPPDYINYPLPYVRPHITEFIRDQGVKLDPPQWLWDCNRSQEWLAYVYENLFNMPPKVAARKAGWFYGFGGSLFTRRRHDWTEQLGEAEGVGIYMLIMSFRDAPGAIPKFMRLRNSEFDPHFMH